MTYKVTRKVVKSFSSIVVRSPR